MPARVLVVCIACVALVACAKAHDSAEDAAVRAAASAGTSPNSAADAAGAVPDAAMAGADAQILAPSPSCPWPDSETPTYDIEVGDCASRTATACPEGLVTVQDQVDSMLGGLVSDAALDLFELKEDYLVVHFEDGCPTGFHGHFRRGLPMLAPQLQALLASVRWECAKQVECAQVMGPSTLP